MDFGETFARNALLDVAGGRALFADRRLRLFVIYCLWFRPRRFVDLIHPKI